jgi:hydroxymethylpyrimidine/phosphomethylpyrimidine kinase
MLSSAETIDVIAESLRTHRVPSIVLDPVIMIFSMLKQELC